MIVALLTPMFLTTTGDVDQAYAAALATVRSCTARNPIDLLLIGQMIALSLATISSASLSMEENIPINLALRLRGNAVSLHRATEKCRQALPEPDPANACDAPLSDAELATGAEIIAGVERSRKRVAEYRVSFAQPLAGPTPADPNPDATQAGIDAAIKAPLTESAAGITPNQSISGALPPPR
jgi:hypothetical protein